MRASSPHRTSTLAEPTPERVQKVLARAGIGSRRACEDLITAGRVTVDGVVAVLGDRIDPERQHLAVDGVPVSTRTDLVYYLLNKPARVVTTAADPEGRRTVVELVPPTPRVHPVGRLDYESEGLLILTNDGDLTHLLTHPRFGVDKTYLAEVEGRPSPAAIRLLREGVDLDDGRTAPARVRRIESHGVTSALEITIHEGRNRQVRRMCEAVGHPVVRLVRTRIGPVRERKLGPGQWRALTPREVHGLFAAAAATAPSSGRGPEAAPQ
jgi:23S rRNA pseudouridine2605 synthase